MYTIVINKGLRNVISTLIDEKNRFFIIVLSLVFSEKNQYFRKQVTTCQILQVQTALRSKTLQPSFQTFWVN